MDLPFSEREVVVLAATGADTRGLVQDVAQSFSPVRRGRCVVAIQDSETTHRACDHERVPVLAEIGRQLVLGGALGLPVLPRA
jgi:hypothetical protein